ncbi:GYDIA family GHMP kinase [uncultured Nonlabens sp.]|uniref:GYDIA family GHMP kinase n=1 Tax=uncultured Nonlabens sp. TaxID=859306 RepID=UPI00261F0528|nr:GYDIA family GHMP kinase [uncultured Nonlabens sp.]
MKVKNQFIAHGKFLITGEYAVLDNVPALAIPLKLNQYLEITYRDDQEITWSSYNNDGERWFYVETNVNDLYSDCINCKNPITIKLSEILNTALHLTSNNSLRGFDAVMKLDFDRDSGMGTSSTLVSLVSHWLGCDPYQLQFKCFGGSGYDVACAQANSAIVYNYNNGESIAREVEFSPSIKNQIFFVYLNRKQNSRDSIAQFDPVLLTDDLRLELANMPNRFLEASNSLTDYNNAMVRHEEIISSIINVKPIKEQLFPDFNGAIKSLGGWGGDFIMATGDAAARQYFIDKGYATIHEWDEVALDS